MPRVAMSYLVNENFAFRGTVSRGYSPPTIAEVRASDAKINPDLEAENGWNYELGLRFKDKPERLYADISVFYYRLNNAIVRRVNSLDQDYFVNAGGTNQKGIEAQLSYQFVRSSNSFIRDLTVSNATTLNELTGVPDASIINTASIVFPKRFSLYIQDQYTSKLPLNDANSVYASSYHLLGFKGGYTILMKKRTTLGINAGVDNMLNKQYSLGNDLNAFGNRYYNPAPLRNYYFGMNLKI
jgi:iron complex outermembrane receptor protein